MKKLLFLLVVLALVPFSAQAQTDTLLFASGFESGAFTDWNGIGGNPYDVVAFHWYSCPTFTGYWCARTGAYGTGQKAYLIDARPSSSHNELVFQWWSSVFTQAIPTQSSSIFRLVTDSGVLLVELRVQWSNYRTRVRLSCRDSNGQRMRYSTWIAMPQGNGLAIAKFQVGWRRGPTDVGGCWMNMYDSAGNKRGTGMLISTGGYSVGKALIGVIANPGGITEQWLDNYSSHSLH